MADVTVTQAEWKAFGDKLETFAEGLPPREQGLLLAILVRAAQDPDEDVEGHMLDPGVVSASMTAMTHIAGPLGSAISSYMHVGPGGTEGAGALSHIAQGSQHGASALSHIGNNTGDAVSSLAHTAPTLGGGIGHHMHVLLGNIAGHHHMLRLPIHHPNGGTH